MKKAQKTQKQKRQKAPRLRKTQKPQKTQKQKKRIGGKQYSPTELLQAFSEASAVMEEGKEGKEDKIFKQIKEFYNDNIPQMKVDDWYHLLIETNPQPQHLYYEEIKKRITDVNKVLTFWIRVREKKVESENSGWQRIFKPERRGEKLDESIKEYKVFFHFLKIYSNNNRIPAADREYYKELIKGQRMLLSGFGTSKSEMNDMNLYSRQEYEYMY